MIYANIIPVLLIFFQFNEYGNFVIHCALRDLRPPGKSHLLCCYGNQFLT